MTQESIGPGTVDPIGAVGALGAVVLLLALATLAVFDWFLVLLLRLRHRPAVGWTDGVAGRRTP